MHRPLRLSLRLLRGPTADRSRGCTSVAGSSDGAVRVLFIGTDAFAATILAAVQRAVRRPVEVLCPLPHREPCPVDAYARAERLRVHRIAMRPDAAWPGTAWPVCAGATEPGPGSARFDLAVVASFGRLIPTHVLDALPLGAVNVHPSLLPRYRGAAPIERCLMSGDTATGVTLVEVSRDRFDAGRILLQQAVPLPLSATRSTMVPMLARYGAAATGRGHRPPSQGRPPRSCGRARR